MFAAAGRNVTTNVVLANVVNSFKFWHDNANAEFWLYWDAQGGYRVEPRMKEKLGTIGIEGWYLEVVTDRTRYDIDGNL